MSEARDKYLKNLETYDCEYFGCQAEDYVAELEHQITELKRITKAKTDNKVMRKTDEAKRQNKQMIESLRYYFMYNLSSDELVFTKIKNYYESVTGKPIEEATK